MAGTALLALWRLTELDFGIDRETVATKSLEFLRAPATGDLARISALEVSAAMGERPVLPIALSIAEGSGCVALRASAVATIGKLGGVGELSWLERRSEDPNHSIRVAIQTAKEEIYAHISN